MLGIFSVTKYLYFMPLIHDSNFRINFLQPMSVRGGGGGGGGINRDFGGRDRIWGLPQNIAYTNKGQTSDGMVAASPKIGRTASTQLG